MRPCSLGAPSFLGTLTVRPVRRVRAAGHWGSEPHAVINGPTSDTQGPVELAKSERYKREKRKERKRKERKKREKRDKRERT